MTLTFGHIRWFESVMSVITDHIKDVVSFAGVLGFRMPTTVMSAHEPKAIEMDAQKLSIWVARRLIYSMKGKSMALKNDSIIRGRSSPSEFQVLAKWVHLISIYLKKHLKPSNLFVVW